MSKPIEEQMAVMRSKFEVLGVEVRTFHSPEVSRLVGGGAPWLDKPILDWFPSKDAAIIAFFRRLSKQNAERKAKRAAGES